VDNRRGVCYTYVGMTGDVQYSIYVESIYSELECYRGVQRILNFLEIRNGSYIFGSEREF
jgi:hypothetical protein